MYHSGARFLLPAYQPPYMCDIYQVVVVVVVMVVIVVVAHTK